MEDKEMYLALRDDLDKISVQLASLVNMINTIHSGLMSEHMEVQAVDSVDCIVFFLFFIKSMVDNCLMQISEISKQ